MLPCIPAQRAVSDETRLHSQGSMASPSAPQPAHSLVTVRLNGAARSVGSKTQSIVEFYRPKSKQSMDSPCGRLILVMPIKVTLLWVRGIATVLFPAILCEMKSRWGDSRNPDTHEY